MLRGGDAGAGTAVPIDGQVDHPQQLATRAAVYRMGDCTVPTGVAVSEDGDVYVSELRANAVSRFTWVGLAQSPVTGWAKQARLVTGTSRPAGLACARVLGRDLLVGAAMRGNDVWWAEAGQDATAATMLGLRFGGEALDRPMGLCLAGAGDAGATLYVTDTRRDRLLSVPLTFSETAGGALAVAAGTPTEVAAFAGLLDRPYDVEELPGSDPRELFVASAHNHRVLRGAADGAAGSAAALTELEGFDLGHRAQAVQFPTGLATDGAVLYVVDQHHNRVLSYDLASAEVRLVSGSFPGGQGLLDDQDFDKLTRESYNRPFDCALASGGSSLVLTSGADNALATVVVSLNPPKVQSAVVDGSGAHGTVQVCFTYKDHPRLAADAATALTFSAELRVAGALVGSASGQTTTQDAAAGFAGTVAVPLASALAADQALDVVVRVHKGEQAAESAPLRITGLASPSAPEERYVSYQDAADGAHRGLRVSPDADAELPADATLHFADLSWLADADYRLRMHDAAARSVAVPDAYKFFAEAAPTEGRRTLVGPRVDLDGVDLSGISDWSGGVSPVHVRGTPGALPAGFEWLEHASNGGRSLFSALEGNGLSYQRADLGDLVLPETYRLEGKLRGAKTSGLTVSGSGGLPPVVPGRKWVQKGGKATLVGPGVDLSGVDLSQTDISGTDLSGAALDGADLSGATATSVSFQGASMGRTKLQGAELGLATFAGGASSVLLSGTETAPPGSTWLRKLGTDEYTLVDDAVVSGGAAADGDQKEARKVRIQMRTLGSAAPESGSVLWHLTRDLRVDSASRGFYLVDPAEFTWGGVFDTIVTDGLLLTGWTKALEEWLTIQSASVVSSAVYGSVYRNANLIVLSSGMDGSPSPEMWVGPEAGAIDEAADERVCAPLTAHFVAGDAGSETLDVAVTAQGRVSRAGVELQVSWIGGAPAEATGLRVASVDPAINGAVVLQDQDGNAAGTLRNPANVTMTVTKADQPNQWTALCAWRPSSEGTFHLKFRVKQVSTKSGLTVAYDLPQSYPVAVALAVELDSEENEMQAVLDRRAEELANPTADHQSVMDSIAVATSYVRDRFADHQIAAALQAPEGYETEDPNLRPARAVAVAWNVLLSYKTSGQWPSSHAQIDVSQGYYNDNKALAAVQLAAATHKGTTMTAEAGVLSASQANQLGVYLTNALPSQDAGTIEFAF